MSGSNTPKANEKELYRRVRANFVAQGTTLNAWCEANGTRIQNVRDAFFGNWKGPKARALVDRVNEAAGTRR